MARVPKVADEAVRDYLEALENPMKAVDWELVEDLERRIDASDDPVERVLLRGEWRRAQIPDFTPLERDFTEFAAAWAAAHDVSGDDFAYEGVPFGLLEAAGLEVSQELREELEQAEALIADEDVVEVTPGPEGHAGEAAPQFESGSPMDRVHAAMGSEPFTINDLVERTNVSRATVRATIDRLDEMGMIEEVAVGDESGGRGPKAFKLV